MTECSRPDLLTTPFTRLVGCKVPIQQAGMGPISIPALVAAVTNEGAWGMLSGIVIHSVDLLEKVLQELKDSTKGRPFGVNYIVPLMEREELEQMVPVAAKYARVVEFFYGWPDESLVQMVHDKRALVSWQIGSSEEAKACVDVGCDLIVAQGIEAGGPRSWTGRIAAASHRDDRSNWRQGSDNRCGRHRDRAVNGGRIGRRGLRG